MSSSHPSTRRAPAADALVDILVDVLVGLGGAIARATRALMFWAAVLLAPSVLAVLVLGITDPPVLVGLVAANVLALVGGHDHRRDAVDDG